LAARKTSQFRFVRDGKCRSAKLEAKLWLQRQQITSGPAVGEEGMAKKDRFVRMKSAKNGHLKP